MATLDDATRRRLLRLARSAIKAALFGKADPVDNKPWPVLDRCGAFVTLRKHGQLRGCIGTFTPSDDLPATVHSMAVAAANDPRFTSMPISAAEMKDIRIDVSVLSPLQRVDDPAAVEIGVHGIYVKRGLSAGCFLPEVAIDNGWDKKTFLTQCCGQKAGMDPLAWQDPNTEIHIFTVEKLSEGTV